ncbi:MAG: hypothetical protein SWK90_01450 [Chloroflexota bacterium]|nr:hypothetical protein [Chloroflexota bacterium]
MSRGKQSPIFAKTYDFLLWLLGRTARFPKNERFRMAKRLEERAFALLAHATHGDTWGLRRDLLGSIIV